MADVTGSIGSEHVELNNAATEATLKLLLQATLTANRQSLASIQQLAQSSGLNPQTVQAASQGLVETGEAGETAADRLTALNARIETTKLVFTTLDETLRKAVAGTLQSSDVFGALSKIPGPAGVVANAFQRLAEFQENNFKTYQQISTAGANFGGSLTEMRQAAAGTYMTLEEFGGIVKKNSTTLSMMGGGVNEGTKAFARLSNQLLSGESGRHLTALGYSATEANQAMLDYIGMTGGRTSAELRNANSTKAITDASTSYLEQLDGLSRITGQSREQQAQELAEASKNAAFQAKLQSMSEEERKKATAGMAQALAVGGKGAVDAFQSKLMGIAPDKAGQMFIATASNAAAVIDKSAAMVTDGSKNIKDMSSTVKEGMRAAQKDFAQYGKEGSMALIRGGGPVGDALQRLGISANKAATMTNEEIDAALERQELDKSEADNMAASIQNLKEFGASIIGIVSPIVSLLTPALKLVSGVLASLASVVNDLPGPIKIVVSALGVLGAAVASYIIIQRRRALEDEIRGRIPGIGGGGGGRGGGGAGGGGGILQSLSGAGAGIGGVLEGLANGLKAFANPAILLGATIFSGSIGIIIAGVGAGIAAAMFLIGQSLPTFSEGLASFSKIDGANLIDVSKGIGALGLAMAAFSAGSAVATVGNVFGSIGDGITKLFGGDDVVTKISKLVTGLTPLLPGLTGVGFAMKDLGKGLLDFSTAINTLDISKAEKVREILSKLNSEKANLGGSGTASTGGAAAVPAKSPMEIVQSEMQTLNKTMQEMLKYVKDTADHTSGTIRAVKSSSGNLWSF